ncbi:MAG: hypothetical protein QG623_466 [Patescibacteria group bacterium]|nr:hypothetical protein [Patescibacteria group bacterium]
MEDIRSLGVDFAAGVVAGRALQTFALEGYAHQCLAHRNVEFTSMAAGVAHNALLLAGMSPNGFAPYHRIHHADELLEPSSGLADSVKAILLAHGRGGHAVDTADSRLLFKGYSYDDDPLLQAVGSDINFRRDSVLERRVAQGGLWANIGAVLGFTALAVANRGFGRHKPELRAMSTLIGFYAGLAGNAVVTAYGEKKVGISGGALNVGMAGRITGRNVRRHNRHHEEPANMDAGGRLTDRAGLGLMNMLGIVKKI